MPSRYTTQEDIELLNSIASIHMMFGMYETAQSILQLSDWADRDNKLTLKLLGKAYFKQGNAELALQTLERLSDLLAPEGLDDEDSLIKARSLAHLGQSDEARNVMLHR